MILVEGIRCDVFSMSVIQMETEKGYRKNGEKEYI